MGLRAVDIFSGAGGLATGIARAGFATAAVCDNDRTSCETLRLNLELYSQSPEKTKIIQEDVARTSFAGLEDSVDVVSGGPPCQPFSNGGRHYAHNDKRNMFPEAIRAIREIRPKAFIFENVVGLRRPKFRDYFEYIRLQLCHPEILGTAGESWASHLGRLEDYHLSGDRSGLNYRLVVQTLNAADYGIPQQRNRVFFVGFQEKAGIHWHFPESTHSRQALLDEMDSGHYWDRNAVPLSQRVEFTRGRTTELCPRSSITQPWVTIREAISDLDDPYRSSDDISADSMHVFRSGARSYKGHTGSRLDEPAKTLKAGVHGVPGGENIFTDDAGKLRYFTLRECARMQTFPDAYKFDGSWSAVMKQLGNAVPVDMAEIIAKSVSNALKSNGSGAAR